MSTPADHAASEAARTYAAPAGLTTPGVYVVVLAGSLVGLLLDVFTGGGIGWIFGCVFIASCAYAALEVRRRDRLAAVTAPPLVFALLMLVDNLVRGDGDVSARLVKAANSLLTYGPMLWIGVLVAAAIVGAHILLERRRATPAPPAADSTESSPAATPVEPTS